LSQYSILLSHYLKVCLPIVLFWFISSQVSCYAKAQPEAVLSTTRSAPSVITGAEQLDQLLPLLTNKRVGCVVNHTSLSGHTHLVDTLLQRKVAVRRIFAPEHGFRGSAEAGETVLDGLDTRTGLPVVSLYGKKKKPEMADLADIDVVIFDIQDVGARFYTYISTLFYLMEACQEFDKELIVLDRPNPNGHYVDGPVLQPEFTSFVGIAPITLVHGCTVGELTKMFAGEGWIKKKGPNNLRFSVIACKNYTHKTPYSLPVAPSPNLPDMRSVLLYPSLCLFEGTTASLGRGTPTPFQLIGHPDFTERNFSFTPKSMPAAKEPPLSGQLCFGYDLRGLSLDSLRSSKQLNLNPLLSFYQKFPKEKQFFLNNLFFDKLAGNATLRQQILAGKTAAAIRASWEPALSEYKTMRKKYLLYQD